MAATWNWPWVRIVDWPKKLSAIILLPSPAFTPLFLKFFSFSPDFLDLLLLLLLQIHFIPFSCCAVVHFRYYNVQIRQQSAVI